MRTRFAFGWVLLFISRMAIAGTPAGPWDNPPALPSPSGTIVNVTANDASDLANKVRNAASNTTILVPAGTYQLTAGTGPLRIGANSAVTNVTLRGATGNRNDVIIRGPGMSVDSSATVPHCLMIEQATDILIANVSLGDVWYHPITIQGTSGADGVRVYNCRLFDAGEQFLKSNPFNSDGSANGSGYSGASDGIVEYCVFEFTTTARQWYTEGVDVHAGHRWIVRNNLFQNIRGPSGAALVGGAIDFWNRSSGTIVENNTVYNCEVGIRLGILDRVGYDDHSGGIIRNNFIYRAQGATNQSDVGIIVNDSPNTQVLHNTVLLNGTYQNAIEVRFAASAGGRVANNLCDALVVNRDSATSTLSNNRTNATTALFVDAASGDLHLLATATSVIDQVAVDASCQTDWDGQLRPANNLVDIGADEFGASAPVNPVIDSAPTPGTNPATVGVAVQFTIGVSSGGSYTYEWNFGDGTIITGGSSISHAFMSAGSFTVTVTVSDSGGGSSMASMSLTVNDPSDPGGGGGGGGGTQKTPMTVTKLQGSMKFGITGKDSVSVAGIIPGFPALFNPSSQAVSLNVSGAAVNFILDAKGKAKTEKSSFALKLKGKRNKSTKLIEYAGGDIPFKASLRSGTWSDDWASLGINSAQDAKNAAINVSVDLTLNGKIYTATVTSLYSGKAGKMGKFKRAVR